MKKNTLIIAALISAQIAHANSNKLISDAKNVLSEQEYKKFTHEIWQKDRKKAPVTDYSEDLKNGFNKQGGNTLTVGVNEQCGFPTISAAINFAAPGDTIFASDDFIVGIDAQLKIDKNLTLVGGLDNTCQVFTANRTHLQLDAAGPVIEIDVTGGKQVTISGFDISGAQSDNIHDYNSGIHVFGNGNVTISNTHIHDNIGFDGGGLSVISGATVVLNENTEIYNNSVTRFGGGIFCGSSFIYAYDVKIGKFEENVEQGNITTDNDGAGGGIYSNSCEIKLGQTVFGVGPVEITYNKSRKGFGIYALNSSIAYTTVGSRISFNERNDTGFIGSGTAIYAGGDSNVRLIDIAVTDQFAGSTFSINDDSYFIMYSQCEGAICSDVRRNAGTAVSVNNNAQGIIRRTLMEQNTTSSEMFSTASNASLTIENVIISQNNTAFTNPRSLFKARESSEIDMTHVTLANNKILNESIFKTEDSAIINFNAGIIWGNNAIEFVIDESNNFNLNDSIIQYDAAGFVNTLQADPQFVSETNSHIKGNSPAIDHVEVTILGDIDRDFRPEGIKSDAGADEFIDLIFKNGFE